jgi:hypothetical protein
MNTKGASMQTYFQKSIAAKGLIPTGVDPRHVEGYVLLSGLDQSGASWPEIRRETKIALACIAEGGRDQAERLALSFGL